MNRRETDRMNIVFLTLSEVESIDSRTIYADLLRCLRDNGHNIFVITPYEKRSGKKTYMLHEKDASILHIETGNVTGATNIFSKGLAQLRIDSIYKKAIRNYFINIKFDMVLYSTPPITLVKAIEYIKKRDNAKTYLLLKDIFPQNAVDLGMLSTKGLKGFLYRYFRKKEKKLYHISDRIGCMSQANVDYVIKHNPEIDSKKVEICPNSVDVVDKSVDVDTKISIRKKYSIPLDKRVFVYGGNLGKPQGIPFLIECLKKCQEIQDAFFLIVGDGTEYHLLQEYVETEKPINVKLMKRLPKEDYDTMVGACDVGLIFLDHRFTIPNFPSRVLAYMQAKLPVLACTDPNTDIGKVITESGFGWWCESEYTENFLNKVQRIVSLGQGLIDFGETGYRYLCSNYRVESACNVITNHF